MPRLKPGLLAAALALSLCPGRVLAESPAPADAAQEDAFLDVLPLIEVPEDVQPIPGAVNEEFRNCRAFWPDEYEVSQKGAEARAYRDIYGLIKVRNVIATKDCSCAGKVADWDEVEAVAVVLRKAKGVDHLTWQHTKEVFDASNDLFPVAEIMCGGSF